MISLSIAALQSDDWTAWWKDSSSVVEEEARTKERWEVLRWALETWWAISLGPLAIGFEIELQE